MVWFLDDLEIIMQIISWIIQAVIFLYLFQRPPKWVVKLMDDGQAILARLMGANSSLVRRGAQVIAQDLNSVLPDIVSVALDMILNPKEKEQISEVKKDKRRNPWLA